MSLDVEYFLAPTSPWTYLGHARFAQIVQTTGARLRLSPVDLGQVFPVSGGLPLPKRAPQRQAYRLQELRRFSEWLGLPLNLHPKHFPVSGDDAARLIIAVDGADGTEPAVRLTGRILAAVWVQERNIADATTLGELLAESGIDASRLEASRGDDVRQRYQDNTRRAIERGVFGSPTYAIGEEIFWGQDRLEFVRRRLEAAVPVVVPPA